MEIAEKKEIADFEELILRAQTDDKDAFRRIVEIHKRYAFAVAFKILLDEEDARDAAQEAFIKLWKNIKQYDFRAKFTTWFYKIIINVSIDKLKARKKKESIFIPSSGNADVELLAAKESDSFTNDELKQIIEKLTEKLSPRQKIVFTLRDLNGLNIETISASLNISEGTVKTNLVYARRKIKELLTRIYGQQ